MNLRFRLPRTRKAPRPSKVVAKTGNTRTQHAWLVIKGDDVHVIAMNDHSAVQVALTADDNRTQSIDGVVEGLLPIEALKNIESAKGLFRINPKSITIGRASYSREIDWPGSKAIPKVTWPKKAKKPLRVGLNARALHDLADAMGTEQVTLVLDMDALEPLHDGVRIQADNIAVEAIPNAYVAEGRKGMIRTWCVPGPDKKEKKRGR